MKCGLFVAAVLAGCASVPTAPLAISGEWGGPHVGLFLAATGGTLDYDCAHGTIGPVVIDAGGRFSAQGSHTPEHGGPSRQGEVLPQWSTSYSGIVQGDRMTLRGTVETGVVLGPFELRRDAEPMIFRCL